MAPHPARGAAPLRGPHLLACLPAPQEGLVTAQLSLVRERLWAWYLAGGALLMLLSLAVPPFEGEGRLINLVGLASVVAILVGVRLHRPAASGAWALFAVGQLLYFVGDVYT